MTEPRQSIATLAAILGQARPASLRLGQQIAAEGYVEFTTEDSLILAVVTGLPGTNKRTVRFSPGGVQTAWSWSCTCMKTESPWCKHVVAAVIAADDAEPTWQQTRDSHER